MWRDFKSKYLIREYSENRMKASWLDSLPDDNYTLFARLKVHQDLILLLD